MEPDRVVIGVEPDDEWAADAVAALYEPLGAPIVRTDVSSAEMIKLASNAFLATKISFINEIANVCRGGRRRRDRGRPGNGTGRPDRPEVPQRRARLSAAPAFPRTLSALKMLAGNSGYHFQLLTLGDRGERAAEAAGDRRS